jgi:hypothetical protein
LIGASRKGAASLAGWATCDQVELVSVSLDELNGITLYELITAVIGLLGDVDTDHAETGQLEATRRAADTTKWI